MNEVKNISLGDTYLCNLYVHNKTGNQQKILLYDLLDPSLPIPVKGNVYNCKSMCYMLSEDPAHPYDSYETIDAQLYWSSYHGNRYIIQKYNCTQHKQSPGNNNWQYICDWSESEDGSKQYITLKTKCIFQYILTVDLLSPSCKIMEI